MPIGKRSHFLYYPLGNRKSAKTHGRDDLVLFLSKICILYFCYFFQFNRTFKMYSQLSNKYTSWKIVPARASLLQEMAKNSSLPITGLEIRAL